MTDTTQPEVLELTRTIRVPPSVSPEAQAAIAMGSAMVPDRLAAPAAFPARDDTAGWKATIAMMDENIAMGFGMRVDVDAAVEKVRIGEVDVYRITPSGADASAEAPVY